MVNVGKREDAMLDLIGLMKNNRNSTLWWVADYVKLGLLSPEIAEHLRWELNKTEENELEQRKYLDAVAAASGGEPTDEGRSAGRVSGGADDRNPALQL